MQEVVSMSQIHSNNVVRVRKSNIGTKIPSCDGLITNDPGVTLSIRVADCLPIFISDLKNDAIGLVHAGWRGLDSEIIKNTIGLMATKFGSNPKNMAIFMGCHICKKHYEIKEDLVTKFRKYKGCVVTKEGKIFLDLAKVAKLQLIELGINAKKIKVDESCTFEDKNLYSFRRDGTENRNVFIFQSRSGI